MLEPGKVHESGLNRFADSDSDGENLTEMPDADFAVLENQFQTG